MNDVSRLEKALDTFQKNVDTSFAGPVPNSLLARQDLEQAIVVLSDRLTPFRDRVSRIKGEGLAFRTVGENKEIYMLELPEILLS